MFRKFRHLGRRDEATFMASRKGFLVAALRTVVCLAPAFPLAVGAAAPDLTFGDDGVVITPLIGPGASNADLRSRQPDCH